MHGKRDVLTWPFLPPVGRTTSGAQDAGRDGAMRDHSLKLRGENVFPKTVEFNVEDSTEPGSRKARETTGSHPEDAGKPEGFSRRDVGARTPQTELPCFSSNVISPCTCCTVNVAFGLYM